jgi:hypothetical protein
MIDTSQYIAIIIKNNVLKCHQYRTTNNPLISDEGGLAKPLFLFLLSLPRTVTVSLII